MSSHELGESDDASADPEGDEEKDGEDGDSAEDAALERELDAEAEQIEKVVEDDDLDEKEKEQLKEEAEQLKKDRAAAEVRMCFGSHLTGISLRFNPGRRCPKGKRRDRPTPTLTLSPPKSPHLLIISGPCRHPRG